MEGSTQIHEAVLFYVINTTSVKVPVDLAQRLIAQQDEDPSLHKLLVETGKDWVARATNVVDILNETPDQPWEAYIIIPNGDVEAGVKQNTIVRSLRPLLATCSEPNRPWNGLLLGAKCEVSPAVKYSVLVGPAAPPLPNAIPQRCVMVIG